MPAPDSPVLLVARFLKSNGYDKASSGSLSPLSSPASQAHLLTTIPQTLATFLQETNLPASSVDPKDPTTALSLEKLLDEKRLFDLSLTLEKVEILDHEEEFTTPCAPPSPSPHQTLNLNTTNPQTADPTIPRLIAPPNTPQSNVLSVALAPTLAPWPHPVLIATTADRFLRLYTLSGTLLAAHPALHPSAILSVTVLQHKWLITTSMTGHLSLSAPTSPTPLFTTRPHTKYATKAALHPNNTLLATASYDGTIAAHTIMYDPATGDPSSFAHIGTITLPTPPEALTILPPPPAGGTEEEPRLVFSRRDSTSIYYHALAPGLPHRATHNLAPAANSWASFHAMQLAAHPSDPSLLGVVTSHVPVMKFMLVRIPSGEVLKECFVGAPQSAYSSGALAWRPCGRGVWVNGDDGVVRGVEVRSGGVVAALRVCGRGEKVRALWAGRVKEEGEEGEGEGEWLVTGGFDKGLKVWRVRRMGEEVVGGAEVEVGGLVG